jgi:hypothetical protein
MSTVGKMTTTTHSYHNMKRFFEEPIMNKHLSSEGLVVDPSIVHVQGTTLEHTVK